MEYRYSISLFLFTIATAAMLNLSTLHIAEAAPKEAEASPMASIAESVNRPVVVARLPTKVGTKFSAKEALASCEARSTIQNLGTFQPQDTETCSPPLVLTSSKVQAQTLTPWVFTSPPTEFIFQKRLIEGQSVSVEIIGSNGLPWPSKVETLVSGQNYIVQVYPSTKLPENTEMHMVANVYNKNRERIENWLVALTIGKPSSI